MSIFRCIVLTLHCKVMTVRFSFSSLYCKYIQNAFISDLFISEFQPGVPWKGIPSVDPESDPYMTPGSMLSSTMSSLNDTEHQLLRDNTGTYSSYIHFEDTIFQNVKIV